MAKWDNPDVSSWKPQKPVTDVSTHSAWIVDSGHSQREWDKKPVTDIFGDMDNSDRNENVLIVSQYDTEWVVWDVVHISDNNVNEYNESFFVRSADNHHIMWQAGHFWTFGQVQSYLDNSVQDNEILGTPTEIIFI